jgi:DNA-binding NarL/FixJ family response regulator
MKVLVVDDSNILRKRIIDSILKIPGYEISGEAGTSIEAISLLNKLKPDVMILDIRMPDGSGIDVLKDIYVKQTSVVTIVLTNYPMRQYREKCMELGADYFFDKSTDFDRMTDVLKTLIIKV